MTDWKERVFKHWNHITALSVRRFGSTSFAEEAVLAAIDGLSKNDWQRLKNYKGQASFKSYLSVLVVRLFEDYSRKRFGRVRPPTWITRLGGIWPKLFVALCLERLKVDWAIEVVSQQEQMQTKKYIENAAYTLLGKIPHCGENARETSFDEHDETCQEIRNDSNIQYRPHEEKESALVIAAIFSVICGDDQEVDISGIHQKFKDLRVSLSPEERLLLKLHFQDGLNVTKAGMFLELSRFQVHGKMKRLMKRLRDEFDRVGLSEEIRHALR